VPTPSQGWVVLAELLDPQNRNPKIRPVVVTTPTEEIKPGIPFWGVAITGTLPKSLTPELIVLPFHPDGACRTGLKKKCAAKCDWLVELRHESIVRRIGHVPDDALAKITQYIAAHRDYQE
jgi:mRNA-degrading endonuclease toxin of MazEF toxin-antitoxin module